MSKKPLAVIILAAGMGTRMKSSRPKVMHEVAHLPMVNWVINAAQSLKPKKIVVVSGPKMPELEAAAKPHTIAIQKVRNGTAGAVKAALPALKNFKGDVLILLGDAPLITPRTLKKLIKAKDGAGISVLGTRLDDPSGYGRLVLGDGGVLEKIVEHKDASAAERRIDVINTGAFCVDGKELAGWIGKVNNKNSQKEYYITDLPEIAAKKGIKTKVAITDDPSEVMGCNSRLDLAEIEAVAQNRLCDAAMARGVTMHDPASVYLAHDTKIAQDVIIEPNVVFGPGVSVAAGTHIKAFSHFEGTKIGKNVTVGPFARLRPGADIAEDVKIGNFVEVKKSAIGKGSKINHLAYVGNCEMGEAVNFSAGAITVNYDGFNKHKTKIGKGAMVGSNANLVAPVSIGNGAFIAAGSTITENVPADALGISREEQGVSKGWAKDYRKKKSKKK